MTTKQVATLLGERPTKLYHHVDLLENAGLVLLVETRQKRGTVEKYYYASAVEFVIDRKLLERKGGARRATTGYESLFLRRPRTPHPQTITLIANSIRRARQQQRRSSLVA